MNRATSCDMVNMPHGYKMPSSVDSNAMSNLLSNMKPLKENSIDWVSKRKSTILLPVMDTRKASGSSKNFNELTRRRFRKKSMLTHSISSLEHKHFRKFLSADSTGTFCFDIELLVDWTMEEDDDDNSWTQMVGSKSTADDNYTHSMATYKLPIYQKKNTIKKTESKATLMLEAVGSEHMNMSNKLSKHMAQHKSMITNKLDNVVFDKFLGHYSSGHLHKVPRDQDFKAQEQQNINEFMDTASLKSILSLDMREKSETLESYQDLEKSDGLPYDQKSNAKPIQEVWRDLARNEEETMFLRNGPSCPDIYEKARNVIDKNELPLEEPHLESAHLDYALIMNMLDGNWGTDEDQTIAQITFKYVHDETFRKRLAKECHSLIDECDCPVHDKITYEKLMNLEDSSFYEIETEEDQIQVVDRLRKEFKEKYEDEVNMDMERVINPGPDSDEDEDYYVEGLKKDEVKSSDKPDIQDAKTWLGLEQPELEEEPKCCDVHSEEALLNRIGYPERSRIKINRLRMKDMVKNRDRKNIEEVVEQMYQNKLHQFRVDEYKGIKWKPKKIYAYKRPDWQRPSSKKRDSYVEQEENTEE